MRWPWSVAGLLRKAGFVGRGRARGDNPSLHVPEDVGKRLTELADVSNALLAAWIEVGRGLATVPASASKAGVDACQFREFKSNGPANVGYAPGQYAGLYVDAIGQQVLALEALLRARRVTVGPWPLIRAELELAGRVAWLLAPNLGGKSGERRVARFYLETISSFQRERFTTGKYDKAKAKQAKKERDAKVKEAKSVFGQFELDFSGMDEIESWEIHGEKIPGLGAGANLFVDTCFTKASALYDFLSDYSHPSLTAIARQTMKVDVQGVAYRPWVIAIDVVEHQVRLACLIFYKACHLVAGYYAIDTSALERWADTVPVTWFNDDPDVEPDAEN